MRYKIPSGQLRVGMYVEDLDRSWLGTPFLFQGFIIESDEQLEQLKQYCEYVYVTAAPEAAAEPDKGTARKSSFDGGTAPRSTYKPVLHEVTHRQTVAIENELPAARRIRRDFRQTLNRMFSEVRSGKSVDSGYAMSIIGELTDSVLGNADANILLSQLKRRDDYAASHGMNVSTMALAFGRDLGLSRTSLLDLGLGAMLIDIGNMEIPEAVLTKKGKLTDEELQLIRKHPVSGVKIIRRSGKQVSEVAQEIVFTHHERMDGSGYPQGLKGDEIPLFGRLVGIVDVYDAATSDRVYRSGNSPSEALHGLYNARQGLFDEELVEKFIKFLGIYPIGSVVRCNSGEVGIVIAQNPDRRLRPKLLLVQGESGVPFPEPKIIDLKLFGEGSGIDISGILQPGEYQFEVADYVERLCSAGDEHPGAAKDSAT